MAGFVLGSYPGVGLGVEALEVPGRGQGHCPSQGCTVHCTLYSAQCTVYTLECIVNTVHCTVYTVY